MDSIRLRMNLFAIPIAALLLFAFGCDDDDGGGGYTGPEITDQEEEDVADDFGSAIADPEEGMLTMWRDSSPGTQSNERGPTNESLDDTVIVQSGGFTIIRVRNFYNILGQHSDFFISGETIRMDQFLSVEGTHEHPSGNRSVTINHHDTLMINGLLPLDLVRIVDGSGKREVDGEFESRFRDERREYSSDYLWAIASLQFHVDQMSHPYPLDGAIEVTADWRYMREGEGGQSEHFVHTAFDIYFDGTRYAELVFESGATFWIDLETGQPHRERPGGGG